MQLIRKFEIQSAKKIIEFLNMQPVGRIATIDAEGYPQVIPMNFVYIRANTTSMNSNCVIKSDAVYMHSHPIGEKLDNIKRNSHVGFEVDRYICFLPSCYFHSSDASQADTLYISIVIKGNALLIEDNIEKANALNALMEKYQKEGRYERLESNMRSVQEVSVIKIVPREMHGKYKIGQHWTPAYRLRMARNIIKREGEENATDILNIMGIEILPDGNLNIKEEPIM
ncbi:MAG: pyridoxamine 5'-phosphate oxidase family protein [Nitrososphaeraceae archaeon]|jgi:nitroimidazol reductase NimA-like FMN-containing flavoprotein (pyridoxamine 5'-phosphate oxidase superfamily)